MSYLHPTEEEIRREAEAEQALREQMRAEDMAEEGRMDEEIWTTFLVGLNAYENSDYSDQKAIDKARDWLIDQYGTWEEPS